MFPTIFLLHTDLGGGDPLMAFVDGRWILAGITSFGSFPNEEESSVKIYTRVSPFVAFIESMTTTISVTKTTSRVSNSTLPFDNTHSHSSADRINIFNPSLFIYTFSYIFFALNNII